MKYFWYTVSNSTYNFVTYHMDYSLEMKRIEHMRILKKREEQISSSSLCFWGTLVIIMSSHLTFFGHLHKIPPPKRVSFTLLPFVTHKINDINFFEYSTNIKTFKQNNYLKSHSTRLRLKWRRYHYLYLFICNLNKVLDQATTVVDW